MAVTPESDTTRGVFLTRVLANDPICRDHRRCVLEVGDFPPAAPGQFVQILCRDPGGEGGTSTTFLRRPFSIAGCRRRSRRCEIDILYRVTGGGTHWLAQLEPGDPVSILGPLGRPFPVFDDRPLALLVGGGIGLPPLIWLAQSLRDAGKRTVAFCGARTADLLPLTPCSDVAITGDEPALAFREFADFATPVVVATDDGSLGAAGTIAAAFVRYLDPHPHATRSAVVYTCGPVPMMRVIADACEARSIRCQVCLERMMACGMGTCQSCVVRIRGERAEDPWRYRLCCTDGPVFDSRLVIWEE